MALQIHPPPREAIEQIKEALAEALPEADSIEVTGGGGHFEIKVVSKIFEGKKTLAKQRLVLGAIAHLMKGDNAPVHAVDKIEALVPE